jgi:hypothetical protein
MLHAQLAVFEAGGLPAGAKLISVTSAQIDSATANPTISLVMPADGAEANRVLVFVYWSEGANPRAMSAPQFDLVNCTQHGTVSDDGGIAGSIGIAWMPEADFPAAGARNFEWTLTGNNRGHAVAMYLLEDADQTTPLGTLSIAASLNQVPPFITAYTATGLAGQFLVTGDAVSETLSGTYQANDIDDNIGNMVVDSEHNPRNSPGGAFRSAHVEGILSASELYQWTNSYNTSVDLDTTVRLWCPVNLA